MPRPDLKTLTRSKAWASCLCDHEDEIRALRKKRWSYREIALHLREERGVTISHNGVHSFVKARARRKLYELPEPAVAKPPRAVVTTPKLGTLFAGGSTKFYPPVDPKNL